MQGYPKLKVIFIKDLSYRIKGTDTQRRIIKGEVATLPMFVAEKLIDNGFVKLWQE